VLAPLSPGGQLPADIPRWAKIGSMTWVDDALAAHGLQRRGAPVLHHDQPWSRVWRIATTSGMTCWWKQNGVGTRFEPALLQALHRRGLPGVPRVLGAVPERGWTLIADAGLALRDEPGGEAVAHWEPVLGLMGDVQRSVEGDVEELLSIGLTDCRPATLAAAFVGLLDRVPLPDGERRRLRRLRPAVRDWCAELAAGPVAPSVQHDDLHGNNVRVSPGGGSVNDSVIGSMPTVTIIDWGDAHVAHPWGTLLVTMRSIAHQAGLDGPADPRLDPVREHYLARWADVVDAGDARRLADLVVRVSPIARALSWERALEGAHLPAGSPFAGVVAEWVCEVSTAPAA